LAGIRISWSVKRFSALRISFEYSAATIKSSV
jgi:hypothetical protein